MGSLLKEMFGSFSMAEHIKNRKMFSNRTDKFNTDCLLDNIASRTDRLYRKQPIFTSIWLVAGFHFRSHLHSFGCHTSHQWQTVKRGSDLDHEQVKWCFMLFFALVRNTCEAVFVIKRCCEAHFELKIQIEILARMQFNN